MAGDVAGAERIATTMMPPGMAQGLQPFFQRLPTLPAIDRAFAVHFGETRATPERYADARLVPPMAALGPDPTAPAAPVAVAAADPVAAPKADRNKRRDRRGRDKPGRVAIPDTRVQVAALPPPPAYRGQPIPTVAPADYRRAAPMNATARANAQALATMGTAAPVPTQAPAAALAASTPSRRTDRVTLASSGMTSLPTPRAVQGSPQAPPKPPPSRDSLRHDRHRDRARRTTRVGRDAACPRSDVVADAAPTAPATGSRCAAGVTARAATTAAPTAVVATGGPRETVVASASPSMTPTPGFSASATGGSGVVAGPTRDAQPAALALASATSPAATVVDRHASGPDDRRIDPGIIGCGIVGFGIIGPVVVDSRRLLDRKTRGGSPDPDRAGGAHRQFDPRADRRGSVDPGGGTRCPDDAGRPRPRRPNRR